MGILTFNDAAIRELRRQCLHHNIFPIHIGRCLNGTPPQVYSSLRPVFDDCLKQLVDMPLDQVRRVVDQLPVGYRSMLQPIEGPITQRHLERVAEYSIAAELQLGFSPISAVLRPKPTDSNVLEALPKLQSRFDHDGLLVINDDFEMLDGGIRYGDHFLHYHQLLRRGYSSNPNFDLLGALARFRRDSDPANIVRVAIDHRRIMKFSDYQQFFEFDTWFGPKFDSSRVDDPTFGGLTVVGRLHPTSLDGYHLVRTEFLWKTNEAEFIKTLEIEELSSHLHPYDNWHINRYMHSQRDMKARAFRHFDGAAKVYAPNIYQQRLASKMPDNANPTHYLKLFRVDGSVDLRSWLSLVSVFYKGNEMVIEYFDPDLFNQEIRPRREEIYKALNRV